MAKKAKANKKTKAKNPKPKKVKAKKNKAKPKKVKAIPKGYHTATPYLIIKGAAEAIEFYKKAFGAKELVRMPGPGGQIMHAEVLIGDSPIMMADETPEMGTRGPKALGGTPVTMCLYVKDVDSLAAQAVAAGATVQRPVMDQFYGDRSGTFGDPFGHVWTIATHIEDVPMEEMHKRMKAAMPPPPPPPSTEMHHHHEASVPQPTGF
jgi:PhnB protein